jgi:hypothetical protein
MREMSVAEQRYRRLERIQAWVSIGLNVTRRGLEAPNWPSAAI